jgi:hypothetical protein
MQYIVQVATTAIEMLYISIYFKGLFGSYNRKYSQAVAAYIVVSVGLLTVSLIAIPIISISYTMITMLFLVKFLFDIKWISAFYSTLLFCVMTVAVDTACMGIMSLFNVSMATIMHAGNARIFYIVIAKLVHIFLILVVIKLSRWRKSEEHLTAAVPLFLCQICSIFISYIMYLGSMESGRELPLGFLIASVGLLYINVVIFLYVERVKKISEIEKQNDLAEQLYNLKLDYFNQVKEDQEQTRSLWHDIKKYMNTMQELLRLGDYANAKDCIDQVTGLFEKTGTVVDVGNTVVSAVLNHSVQKARRQNIDVDMDIRVKPELYFSAADLSVIIGNTLDNAIEAVASMEAEQRKITIQLIQKNDLLFYEISNPINNEAPPVQGKIIQGYGLRNVRRCVDKYKGEMTIDSANGWHKVTVLAALT